MIILKLQHCYGNITFIRVPRWCPDLRIQFGDNDVVWSEANLLHNYSWHMHLAKKVIFKCIIQPINSGKKKLRIKFFSLALQCNNPHYSKPLSTHNNKNISKGTAKKTKTNSLWIICTKLCNVKFLNFMSLIFDSVFCILFPFPWFRFRLQILESMFKCCPLNH